MNKWIGLTSAVLEMTISHAAHSPEYPYIAFGRCIALDILVTVLDTPYA